MLCRPDDAVVAITYYAINMLMLLLTYNYINSKTTPNTHTIQIQGEIPSVQLPIKNIYTQMTKV